MVIVSHLIALDIKSIQLSLWVLSAELSSMLAFRWLWQIL